MDTDGRRVRKTKSALYAALTELLREKRYASITIQDIIDRADIGRTTFYAHFQTKDDLLSGCVEMIFESFNQPLESHTDDESAASLFPVEALFAHIGENKSMLRGIMMSEGGDILFERFKEYWGERLWEHLEKQMGTHQQLDIPKEIILNFIAGSLIELIRFWLKVENPYTPQEMEFYYHRLIVPSIASTLSNASCQKES